jgi:hypothetical protein
MISSWARLASKPPANRHLRWNRDSTGAHERPKARSYPRDEPGVLSLAKALDVTHEALYASAAPEAVQIECAGESLVVDRFQAEETRPVVVLADDPRDPFAFDRVAIGNTNLAHSATGTIPALAKGLFSRA